MLPSAVRELPLLVPVQEKSTRDLSLFSPLRLSARTRQFNIRQLARSVQEKAAVSRPVRRRISHLAIVART